MAEHVNSAREPQKRPGDSGDAAAVASFNVETLRWVVCPVCHAALRLRASEIVCEGCGRRYPIVDGIPVLLPARAL